MKKLYLDSALLLIFFILTGCAGTTSINPSTKQCVGPDLAITHAEIKAWGPKADDKRQVAVNIKNIGLTPSEKFTVYIGAFRKNNTMLAKERFNKVELPQENTNILVYLEVDFSKDSFKKGVADLSEASYVAFYIDATKQITECNEENNHLNLKVPKDGL